MVAEQPMKIKVLELLSALVVALLGCLARSGYLGNLAKLSNMKGSGPTV